jgi:hypothetical protein
VWTKSKAILLLALFVLLSVPLWSGDSYIDQVLAELDILEASLSRSAALIDNLQNDLLKEKLWSISLQRTIEALESQSKDDRELLTQQSESLNQAEAASIKLERSLKLSKALNKIFIPATVGLGISTGILLYLLTSR